MKWSFPKQVLAALILSFVAGAYPLARYASREILTATIAGALLSTLNIAIGYAAIEYAFNKSMTTFTKFVFGGMGIRLLVILGVMTFLIAVARLQAAALTVSLFYFYVVFLVLEILFIQKKTLTKTSNDATADR